LPSAAGAGVVVVVEVDSSVLVTAGASVGAAGVTVVVLEVDSWVLVAVGSSALLQPANKAKVTKPVAIIVLVFIVVSSSINEYFLGGVYLRYFKVIEMLTHKWLYFSIKRPFLNCTHFSYVIS
jgi:hypothetical protein